VKRSALDHAKLARTLGSQARGRVSAESGYFGALELAQEVRRRFKSPASGGRATDPGWTAKRLIPMRPDTLARLQELATEVSRYAKARVEPLQLAALIIECHLAPPGRTQGTQKAPPGLGRLNPGAAPDGISCLDLVRDLAGCVDGPPDLSAGMREPARRSHSSSRNRKRSRRGPVSRQTHSSAKPFPDRSAFRRSMPVLDPPLSARVIHGRKDRS
jgi:hypothetical protein